MSAQAEWEYVFSVEVQESDSNYLGLPTSMHVAENGDFFVSDAQHGNVIQIRRNGSMANRFGSRGSGPGEFQNPGYSQLVGDTLFVVNPARKRVAAFNSISGQYLSELDAADGMQNILSIRGVIYGVTRPDTLGRNIVRIGNDSIVNDRYGWSPSFLRSDDRILSVFDGSAILFDEDKIFAMFQVSDSIYTIDFIADRNEKDIAPTVENIPLRLRKGARPELIIGALSNPDLAIEAAYGTSIPVSISKKDSLLRILFYDPELSGARVLGSHILAWKNNEEWCEAIVPLPSDPRPAVSLRGDTVFALVQFTDSLQSVRSRVDGFVISRADYRKCG